MKKENALDDTLLDAISGGRTLPDNWEKLAKMYAPALLKQYGHLTYEEACLELEKYFTDPEDLEILKKYIKQYFKDACASIRTPV